MAHGHRHRSSPPRGARFSLPLTVVVLVLGASGGGASWYAPSTGTCPGRGTGLLPRGTGNGLGGGRAGPGRGAGAGVGGAAGAVRAGGADVSRLGGHGAVPGRDRTALGRTCAEARCLDPGHVTVAGAGAGHRRPGRRCCRRTGVRSLTRPPWWRRRRRSRVCWAGRAAFSWEQLVKLALAQPRVAGLRAGGASRRSAGGGRRSDARRSGAFGADRAERDVGAGGERSAAEGRDHRVREGHGEQRAPSLRS